MCEGENMLYKVYVRFSRANINYLNDYVLVYCGKDEKEYNRVIMEHLGYGGRVKETNKEKFATTISIKY